MKILIFSRKKGGCLLLLYDDMADFFMDNDGINTTVKQLKRNREAVSVLLSGKKGAGDNNGEVI